MGRRYRSLAAQPARSSNGAAAARRTAAQLSAAKASSVTFPAAVGGCTQTCFCSLTTDLQCRLTAWKRTLRVSLVILSCAANRRVGVLKSYLVDHVTVACSVVGPLGRSSRLRTAQFEHSYPVVQPVDAHGEQHDQGGREPGAHQRDDVRLGRRSQQRRQPTPRSRPATRPPRPRHVAVRRRRQGGDEPRQRARLGRALGHDVTSEST